MTSVYLPWIAGISNDMNARAAAFAEAWMGLLGERAAEMRPHWLLILAAQGHARYLDSRTPEEIAALANVPHAMHIGRGGSHANERVLATGFRLPSFWEAQTNNVESCCRSPYEPAQAAQELAEHAEHRDHMLGLAWFADHVLWGVGACGEDYVAITAPLEIT